jgi:hypothetical protein
MRVIAHNREYINDTVKLMMHRLIARAILHDPSLVERAKNTLAKNAKHYPGYAFLGDWQNLLSRDPSEVRHQIVRRDEEMTRMRVSSPLQEVLDLGNEGFRRRLMKAAKRVADRSFSHDHRPTV